MKILVIGFLTFIAWSSIATYTYVCKIQGLCDEPEIIEFMAVTQEGIIADEAIPEPSEQENATIPKNLVIYFAFDKSDFIPDSQTGNYILKSKAYLDQNLQARLRITGHTDAVGSDAYNQALGHRRAQSVLHYFESEGMTARNSQIESKGEKEPADDNDTAAGRANNRRTVVTIIK
ncbi:MAG: OmpA family protein [Bacteroidales bacterium]|nr:OmpA family protein [Bacteroidales bacterium]